MIKILIEGSGCTGDSCVMNLTSSEWIIKRPSLMLWADSIYISNQDYSYLTSGSFVTGDSEVSEDLAAFVSSLKNEGIVELFDPGKILGKISRNSIEERIQQDLRLYGASISEDKRARGNEPPFVEKSGVHFCPVMLEGIYSSLLESRFLGCECVMDADKATFALSHPGENDISFDSASRVFDELYTILVPELSSFHEYRLFCPSDKKNECIHGADCSREREKNLRVYLDEVMLVRENPALRSLKKLIEAKEQELGAGDGLLRSAVLKDIAASQRKVYELYPRAKKWMKYVASISSGAIAAISGSPSEALLPAVGLLGASQMADASLEWLTERERWKIAFCESFTSNPGHAKNSDL